MAATIYVIDDDAGLRAAYAAALSQRGYQIETASDGIEGQKLLASKGKPTLILLDMLMPNLDGIGFLQALRQDEANQDIKVVVTSNFASMPEASELGVAKYISKFEKNPEAVAAAVDNLLKAG
jgi:CheY-like chemotaxis protein